MKVIKKIEQYKIIPVITIENDKKAIPLGEALLKGGLPIAEITFRTEQALNSIKILKENFPEILIGAGTILKVEQIQSAYDAGAEFIVSPGFNPTTVDYCLKNDIIIIPGVNNPSFIEWGLEKGLDLFKFFPAELSGGIKMLQAFAGPFSDVKFIPTGGINEINLIDYLRQENVIACGGSWLVKKKLIEQGKFGEITELVKKALDLIKTQL
ncbi:MAG: bifunctional 4-hydroxy-2-oxoglutarate aldolase/2-dehydro-3-deoxy-phosphogluconate aldolase [Promethearchaeota archaeon]